MWLLVFHAISVVLLQEWQFVYANPRSITVSDCPYFKRILLTTWDNQQEYTTLSNVSSSTRLVLPDPFTPKDEK